MADDEDAATAAEPEPFPAGAVPVEALGNPLRVEDEEYEVVDEVALVAVRWSSSLDDARTTARLLVEHGLGATVAPAPAPAAPAAPGTGGPAPDGAGVARPGGGDADGFEVRVLPDEAARAADVLAEGPGPAAEPGSTPGEEPALVKAPVPWKTLVAIWLAAMILLPLVAGLGTYLISR
jgi:hypothetical protein